MVFGVLGREKRLRAAARTLRSVTSSCFFIHAEREFSGPLKPSGEELDMKKTRHTEEQIAFALKQAETGTSVAEVIRRMGISEQTFYR